MRDARSVIVERAAPADLENDQGLERVLSELRARCGEDLQAVLLYGSYLRGVRDTLLDFYVVVDGYRGALGTALSALAWVGLVLFGVAVIFTLITLPVEFDASRRAKKLLSGNGVLIGDEIKGVDKVLDAAALTYVAAAVAAVGQFAYYLLLLGGGRRR